MTASKATGDGTNILVLDFSDSTHVPCDGDADAIEKMIDKATRDAIAGVPESYGATEYDFPMAYDVASGACVPLSVTVKPPVRRAIGADVPVEEAGMMLEGYVRCDKLYQRFRMAGERTSADIMDGVIVGSIRSRIPSVSDASAKAIISHVRASHSAMVDVVNAVEAECNLIVRVAFGVQKRNMPARKTSRRRRVSDDNATTAGKDHKPTDESVTGV